MAVTRSHTLCTTRHASQDPPGDWEVLLHDHAWRPVGGDDSVYDRTHLESWCEVCGWLWPLDIDGPGRSPRVTHTCEVLAPRSDGHEPTT